ncbi:MAG: ABA4-like family protein [Cyanobacteria bacterium J06634_5]
MNSSLVIDYLYNGANVFVLPFWLLMVMAPSWSVTRRVMASTLPFVPLALAYIFCFINSLDPDAIEAFANPTLSALAGLFADERVMATGWIHFVVMDLFVGRWIYLQGQEKGIFTRHSLALCLFAGPIGLLLHLATTQLQERWLGLSDVGGSEALS